MRQLVLQEPRVAPELRRPPERERAAQAVRLDARLAVVAEEHVHRADEPVLVRRVQLHPFPVAQDACPAGERDVVEVDDVEALRSEDLVELPGIEGGPPGQIGRGRGSDR